MLTLANATPGEGLTSLPPYPLGATVYVLADSVDFSTSYGAVRETNESNNLAQSTVGAAGSSTSVQARSTAQRPVREDLPGRR